MSTSLRFRSDSCMDCPRRASCMFCDVSPEALQAFDRLGFQIAVPRGAVIFREGYPSSAVSVVCSGQVKLSCGSREGKTLIVRIANHGDLLGLGAAISGTPYEVTAEALEPVVIKNIRKEEFLAFIRQHSEASMHAARTLSQEYRTAFFDARRLALAPTVAGRLASVLLEWARTRCMEGRPQKFTMPLTHEELGNLAGTSRETVTRALGRFQKDKLIEVKGATVTILDGNKLAALACA